MKENSGKTGACVVPHNLLTLSGVRYMCDIHIFRINNNGGGGGFYSPQAHAAAAAHDLVSSSKN
jgi:hypothetical protein